MTGERSDEGRHLPIAASAGRAASGSLGSPGRSALAAYRRRRSEELAGCTRTSCGRYR